MENGMETLVYIYIYIYTYVGYVGVILGLALMALERAISVVGLRFKGSGLRA